MSTSRTTGRTGRPGFTLIELIVVIAIISFIAGLAVLLGPTLESGEATARGASGLQGNLFIAKQQALRDRNPYGLRFFIEGDPNGQLFIRGMRYIRQPDDFAGGPTSSASVNPMNLSTVTFQNVDLSGGLGMDQTLWPVRVGDYIQIRRGEVKRITAVAAGQVQVAPPFTSGEPPTPDYRIMRAPREVAGEDTINLPEDILIDLGTQMQPRSILPGYAWGAPTYDILFDDSGVVLGPPAVGGKIILWVRNSRENPAVSEDQTLIVVYTRTGLIGAFQVDTSLPPTDPNYNPYSFVQDPRAAGL